MPWLGDTQWIKKRNSILARGPNRNPTAPSDFCVSAVATGTGPEEWRCGTTREELNVAPINEQTDLSCGFKLFNALPFLLEAFLFLADDLDPSLCLFSYYSLLCALYGGKLKEDMEMQF